MKRVTRRAVRLDRVACPRLIRRFIAPEARSCSVPADRFRTVAAREEATSSDNPGAAYAYPESAGLRAFSEGLHLTVPDDHRKLEIAFPLYDALHAFCETAGRTA